MDNYDDVDDAHSIEELEQRRLALEKVTGSEDPPPLYNKNH